MTEQTKNMEDKITKIREFYKGYISALIDVIDVTSDIPEVKEKIRTLLEGVIDDLETELRESLSKQENHGVSH